MYNSSWRHIMGEIMTELETIFYIQIKKLQKENEKLKKAINILIND